MASNADLMQLCRIDSIFDLPLRGQHVGITGPGITIVHMNTGIRATCGHDRNQIKNRDIALSMIEFGLAEIGWDWRAELDQWAHGQMAAIQKASNEGPSW